MPKLCFICTKPLTSSKCVTVERGLRTLIDASIQRKDKRTNYLKNKTKVIVHIQCRKQYTRKSTIIAAVKRRHEEDTASPSNRSLCTTRVSQTCFSFENCCLFCSNVLNEEKQQTQKSWRQVETALFKDLVMKLAQYRLDNNTKTIVARLELENDLVTAKCKYHDDCLLSFFHLTTGGNTHCPEEEELNISMNGIFQYIDNSEDCQFSLKELKNVCKNDSIDNRTIKLRLKLNYGDKIIITEKPGNITLVCLLENRHGILYQAVNEKKKPESKEERLKILAMAAAIIHEDMTSVVVEKSRYSLLDRIFEDGNNSAPESLIFVLEQIILKKKLLNLHHIKFEKDDD